MTLLSFKNWFFLLILAGGICFSYEHENNFEKYKDTKELMAAYSGSNFIALAENGGKGGGKALFIKNNGQFLNMAFSAFESGKQYTIKFDVKLESGKSFLRAVFGGDNISWNKFSGGADIVSDKYSGKSEGKVKVSGADWHTVEFKINLKAEGKSTYSVICDGENLYENRRFKGDITHFRIIYLGKPADGINYIDNLEISEVK